jgi:hypothetical protein
MQVALGSKPESPNSELRKIADSTVPAIIKENLSGLHLQRNFKEKQTTDSLKKFMASQNSLEREAAIDNYPQDDKSILPILIQMIPSEPSIAVLYKAVARFNSLTGQSFGFWQTKEIVEWWDKNRASYE